MNTDDIITAMVAEHAQNELASEEARIAASAEIEREKLVKYDWAIKTLRSTGALTDTEIDALFADADVRLKGVGSDYEEIVLRSVTVEGLCVSMWPRLGGKVLARIYAGGYGVHKSADIFESAHRVMALAVVATAVKLNRELEANARFAEAMRIQS